jgi:hypothetical protein
MAIYLSEIGCSVWIGRDCFVAPLFAMTTLFFDILLHQRDNLARLGMAMQFKLRKEQSVVDGKLETAAIGRNKGDRCDLRLKLAKQLGYQTGRPVGIVSDGAIDQIEFQ